jgi:ribosomal-protein-alanine acetyltransferase
MLAPTEVPLAIRPARPHDLGRIVWLEEHCFPDPWPASILAHELAHPRSFLLVASRPGGPAAGYVSFRQGIGEAELLRLAVEGPARRQGVGRALVEAGVERLRSSSIASCFLEVRPDNRGALELYRVLGFALTGRRRGYYRDGSDALVYSLQLRPAAP